MKSKAHSKSYTQIWEYKLFFNGFVMKLLSAIFFLILLFGSCTPEEVIPENEKLIFTNSYPIKIPSYTFQDSDGETYSIRGDTSYQSAYPDTVNSLPALAWDSLGIRIITAAIFTDHLRVTGNRIVNTDDIIWQWHSGMETETGKEGFVKYSDGRSVINDSIDYDNLADSLDEGHYYWAVWGWGESGTRIWYSSRELEFYVLK